MAALSVYTGGITPHYSGSDDGCASVASKEVGRRNTSIASSKAAQWTWSLGGWGSPRTEPGTRLPQHGVCFPLEKHVFPALQWGINPLAVLSLNKRNLPSIAEGRWL